MKQTSNATAYLALVLVSIFWGTTYLAARIGVQHMHGMSLAGIRQTVAGIILIGYFMLFRGYKLPEKSQLGKLAVIGTLMLCGSNGLMTWAMQYVPSGLGAIIGATVPIWITIFSFYLVAKSKFSFQLIIGILLGFGGVVGIFYDYFAELMKPDFRFGIILIMIACILWALGSVLTAKWALDMNPLYGAGFQMIFSGVEMLFISILMGQHFEAAAFTTELWGALLYLIFFGSIIGYSSYIFALNRLPPSLVSVYAYINPVVALLLGWVWFRERLNWNMALFSLVILLGVYLVNRSFNKAKAQSYEHSE
ncbi:EamA family transporter [Chitinophaga sedimenti]|uniref:EamA family transporter n=1 Tax=Chitinophaga sedimenti TaxID=2033606 RepID=UPI002006199B|nr:EamA family transporter [Chitinophaga sedimenti]MCK7556389.1 EamA family transporter [Chitinophaga sedimenti]